MTGIEPGWYKDPADPTTQRYWDGDGWLGAAIPADATAPDGPPPANPEPPAPAVPPSAAAPGATGAAAGPPAPGGPGSPVTAGGGRPDGPGGWPGAALGGPYPPPGSTAPGQYPPPGPAAAGQYPPGQYPPPGPAAPGWPAPPPGWPGPHPAGPAAQGWAYPAPRPHGYALAPYGARLVARIIDALVVLGLNVVGNGWFVWQFLVEFSPVWQAATQARTLTDPPPASPRAQYLLWMILLVATALWAVYEVPALGNTGQTLGKRLMHIKVVPVEADERLGYGRAFRRWGRLGLWTPLWLCCIGAVFQLIDALSPLFDQPLRRALHDKAARTVVVWVPAGPTGVRAPDTDAPSRPDDPSGGSR